MVYVALLRGINVGGNNKVEMARLKAAFERLRLTNVKTYINSGNVIFTDTSSSTSQLVDSLEHVILEEFGFKVKVILRNIDEIARVAKALPDRWKNDADMKCDVMFLYPEVDSPEVLKRVVIKPEIDDVKYEPDVILWRVDRQNVTRSGLMRLAGTELYRQMTIRNCNTARKLYLLMQNVSENDGLSSK